MAGRSGHRPRKPLDPSGVLYTLPKPMRSRKLPAFVLVAISALSYSQHSAGHSPKMTTKLTPEQVHRSAIVIDTHADTPQRVADDNFDLADPLNGGNWNFESAQKGNLGAEFFSIWVDPEAHKGH